MTVHHVYRCFDAEGRLLYVGCTTDLAQRISQHRSPCFTKNPASAHLAQRMTNWTSEEYPDRESGRAAERAAIEAEAPLLNVLHNGGRHDHSWTQPDNSMKADLEAALARFG